MLRSEPLDVKLVGEEVLVVSRTEELSVDLLLDSVGAA